MAAVALVASQLVGPFEGGGRANSRSLLNFKGLSSNKNTTRAIANNLNNSKLELKLELLVCRKYESLALAKLAKFIKNFFLVYSL